MSDTHTQPPKTFADAFPRADPIMVRRAAWNSPRLAVQYLKERYYKRRQGEGAADAVIVAEISGGDFDSIAREIGAI